MAGYSPQEGGGIQRTEFHCHECGTQIVAELDYDINGDHVVACPRCGHEHCRHIENGKITEVRWDGRNGNSRTVQARSVWKSSVLQAQTSTVSHFLRDRWLNRSDLQ